MIKIIKHKEFTHKHPPTPILWKLMESGQAIATFEDLSEDQIKYRVNCLKNILRNTRDSIYAEIPNKKINIIRREGNDIIIHLAEVEAIIGEFEDAAVAEFLGLTSTDFLKSAFEYCLKKDINLDPGIAAAFRQAVNQNLSVELQISTDQDTSQQALADFSNIKLPPLSSMHFLNSEWTQPTTEPFNLQNTASTESTEDPFLQPPEGFLLFQPVTEPFNLQNTTSIESTEDPFLQPPEGFLPLQPVIDEQKENKVTLIISNHVASIADPNYKPNDSVTYTASQPYLYPAIR